MIDWQNAAVESAANMAEVLQIIDQGGMQIALVVDDGCHLMGTITDGDVRRALLRGDNLGSSASEMMNSNPVTGLIDEAPENWQRAMQRNGLRHLPLLDSEGCIVGLTRFEMPQEPRRDNPVVLMAGGLGTRLRPLTNSRPKPLLKIGAKPILETIIENFSSHGFREFYLCVNYKGDMIEDYFGAGEKWNVDIHYIQEDSPLGTAGALSLLPNRPDQPFFVMNGDVLTKVDFVRLLDFHQRQKFSATMCVREYHYQVPYGVVKLNGHRISSIVEKPLQRFNVNAGIYVLDPEVLDQVPAGQFYDMPFLLEQMMREEKAVGSFPLRDYWIDIGQMDQFEQAHSEFKEHFA